jgi:hypothetical protein
MGDILNINSVVICTNILDVDTVLQGNILNVNSVLVNCEEGNSWDCSATTVSDTCTGLTEINAAHSQRDMSQHFSDNGAYQGLDTTDYYYLDYTASTSSSSCLVKGSPKRQLLGWSIDSTSPQNALYTSAAGGGLIHTGWSTFISALNATGLVAASTSIQSAPLTSILNSFGPPSSSFSPIFKDCKCVYDCNCVPLSDSSGAYSSMTQCEADDKTCCAECEVKSAIELAYSDTSCSLACDGTCEYYFTDVVSPLPCPLSIGDHLYTDTSCTPVERGYYSPNNCDTACEYCYEVGSNGEIIAVTLCDEEKCNIVVIYTDGDGFPCPTIGGCDDVCKVCDFTAPYLPYTDAPGSPPILQVGHHLYALSDCACETWAGGGPIVLPGLYKWRDATTGYDYCIELGEFCKIQKKTACSGIGPDDPVEIVEPIDDVDIVWETDEETGYQYYDLDGYRYYDVDGDGEVDFSEPIEEEEKKDKEGPDGPADA